MTHQFTATDTDFSARPSASLARLIATFFLTSFIGMVYIYAIWTTRYPRVYPDGSRMSKWAGRVEAFMNMSATTFLIIALIAFVAAIALARAQKYGRHDREFIIGITFLDEQKKLTLHTKTRSSHEYRRTHKYSDLTYERNRLADSMTAGEYHTLTLVKDGRYFAGHLFLDHFTWDTDVQHQLTTRIKSTIKPAPDQEKIS